MDRNKGSLLWDRAKQIIPGGNQLLSKRAEQFLPDPVGWIPRARKHALEELLLEKKIRAEMHAVSSTSPTATSAPPGRPAPEPCAPPRPHPPQPPPQAVI